MIATTTTLPAPRTVTRQPYRFPPSRGPRFAVEPRDDGTPLSAVATLVLWVVCCAFGAAGLLLPYARPQPAKTVPPPVQIEKIEVELDPAAPAVASSSPRAALMQPPASLPLSAPPAAPALAATEPIPSLAFAVPVEGAIRLVDAATASLGLQAAPKTAVASTTVQSLVFGQGEGRQPAPVYPARATRLGQEGTVLVRLSVDTDGRVTRADVSEPCTWPLLNEAAVQTVRERWNFPRGPQRLYEVAIRFRLKK